jgi:hypothetical protein
MKNGDDPRFYFSGKLTYPFSGLHDATTALPLRDISKLRTRKKWNRNIFWIKGVQNVALQPEIGENQTQF